MKTIFVFAAIAGTLNTVGVGEEKRSTPEEIKQVRAEQRLKAMNETGGFVADPRFASGKYRFVNIQTDVSEDVLRQVAHRCQNACLILTDVVKGEKFDITKADALVRREDVNLVTFIVDAENLPMSMLCPEAQWSLINVKLLKADSPTPEILSSRLRKMMSRTMAMMFQCGYSISPKSTVQPIRSIADLDSIAGEGIATDCQSVVQKTAEKLGFKTMRRVFYRTALEEGWADDPVTDIQKKCKELWLKNRDGGDSTSGLKIKVNSNGQTVVQ